MSQMLHSTFLDLGVDDTVYIHDEDSELNVVWVGDVDGNRGIVLTYDGEYNPNCVITENDYQDWDLTTVKPNDD